MQKRVTFQASGLGLEGVLHSFDETGTRPAVVVCHPHPLYGGTMHSSVVVEVCDELNRKGIVALRFNFRGVGASEGRYGEGVGEVEDVGGAISFLSSLANVDPNRIGLAGYSFGATVGLSASATDSRIQAVAAISLPVAMHDVGFFAGYTRPKMFIVGGRDEFAPTEELARFVDGLPEPKRYEVIARADHFWLGFERLVAAHVANFFVDYLPQARHGDT